MSWLQDWIHFPAYALGVTGILLLLSNRRSWLLILLTAQYFLATWLMLGSVQLVSAGAILLAGVLSALMLFLTVSSARFQGREPNEPAFPSSVLFRIAVGVLGILASIGALRADIVQLAGLDPMFILGGLFALFSGFMQLGVTRRPLRVAIGLLTMLTGFSVVYIALEPSLAVVALLALVHLGIALTCSYVLLQVAGSSSKILEDKA